MRFGPKNSLEERAQCFSQSYLLRSRAHVENPQQDEAPASNGALDGFRHDFPAHAFSDLSPCNQVGPFGFDLQHSHDDYNDWT